MPYIQPLSRDQLSRFEPIFQAVEARMGFVPSSFLTMAHWPELLQHYMALAGTVLNAGAVDPGVKQMIAYVTSNAAGCRYCQAHTSHSAVMRGVGTEKMARAFEFDQNDLFSDPERAALRVALHEGTVPNGVEAVHMEDLQNNFCDQDIVEISPKKPLTVLAGR